MNFDHTYITLANHIVFEPVVILTNTIFFILCFIYYKRLINYGHAYSGQMALFILLMGLSSLFGAIAHGVHYQMGTVFFDTVFFLMNALSLFSIYFCFRAPYTYYKLEGIQSKTYINLALLWIFLLLIFSLVHGNFLLIKIHAGIALMYSLVVHYKAYKRNGERGSKLIVNGISVSFLSIIVHSLKLSVHAYFNYKDIAHVIMIVSLMIIYRGIKLNVEELEKAEPVAEVLK